MSGREQPAIKPVRGLDAQMHARYGELHLHHQDKVQEVRDAFIPHQGWLCISTVTAMELIYGAEKSATPGKDLTVVEGFAARLDVLAYDHKAACIAASLEPNCKRLGSRSAPTTK